MKSCPSQPETVIVNVGHKRTLDLAVEVPPMPLGPIASNEMWDAIYDRLVTLVSQHRSTLVFVNTRRMVERLAHNLGERMGGAKEADLIFFAPAGRCRGAQADAR